MTRPVLQHNLIAKIHAKRSMYFIAHHNTCESQLLNFVPSRNLGLKLDDQQLRISKGHHALEQTAAVLRTHATVLKRSKVAVYTVFLTT